MKKKKELSKLTESLSTKIKNLYNCPIKDIDLDSFIETVKEYEELLFLQPNNSTTDKLIDITDLKDKYSLFLKEKIKTLIKNKNMDDAIELIIGGIQLDTKNIVLAEDVIKLFADYELYSEGAELYKIMFLYTSNPKYFEKTGDLYMLKNDYDSAVDSYLNYVEMTDGGVNVYKKLANLFNKLNDKISENACLEQIKIFEEENAK